VYQEVLQGAKNEKEFELLKEYLNTIDIYDVCYGKKSYEDAAKLYIKCRKAGITPRSTIDLIIAQIAIDNNLLLFHNDNDFVQISQIASGLRLL
jgi:predicted nucleic acid-binding protein